MVLQSHIRFHPLSLFTNIPNFNNCSSLDNDTKIEINFWIAVVLYSNHVALVLLLIFTKKEAQHNGRRGSTSDWRNKYLSFWYAEIVGPP